MPLEKYNKKYKKVLDIAKQIKKLPDYSSVRVIADIHADGDIYIKLPDKSFKRIGKIGESDFGVVPDPYYKKVKKLLKI